jgi:hypothetical protein
VPEEEILGAEPLPKLRSLFSPEVSDEEFAGVAAKVREHGLPPKTDEERALEMARLISDSEEEAAALVPGSGSALALSVVRRSSRQVCGRCRGVGPASTDWGVVGPPDLQRGQRSGVGPADAT